MLLVVTGLPGLGYITIHIPRVQSVAVNEAISFLEDMFGTTVSFSTVQVRLFNHLTLNDLYIEDLKGDTLLFSKKVTGNLRYFNSRGRELYMNRIILKEPDIRFSVDSAGTFNLSFITDKLKRKDTTKAKLGIRFNEILLDDGTFRFHSERGEKTPGKLDFSNLHLTSLDLTIKRLNINNDTVSFNIDELAFLEESGLRIRNWQSSNTLHPTFSSIRNLKVQTAESSLNLPEIKLNYPSWASLKYFTDSTGMDIEFETSNLALADVAYFVPALNGLNEKILLEGRLNGMISDLKGRDISLFYGGNTFYRGDFDFIGLPDIEETFIFFEVEDLVTTVADIESLDFPGQKRNIVLPDNFRQLGMIKYHGNFTGFLNDFVAYGNVETNLGDLSLDLSFRPDSGNLFSYQGAFQTNGFGLGKLTSTEEYLGNITLSANLEGTSLGGRRFRAHLEGLVDSVYLNGYQYTNIDLEGRLTEKMFDGSVEVEDPNIKLSFLGLLDFSGEVPEFDFTLNVPRANLFNLNIDKQDSSSTLSLLMTANFLGSNLDNLDGDIKLFNSRLKRLGEEWQIYDFTLSAVNRPDTSVIRLRTDFLNAEIRGKYEFAYLPEAFRYLLSQYVPSLEGSVPEKEILAQNNFNYQFHFRNLDPLMKVFLPEYHIANGTRLEGRFAPAEPDFSFTASSDRIDFGKNYFSGLSIRTDESDSLLRMNFKAEHLFLGKNFDLNDLRLVSHLQDDSLALDILWDDRARLRNMGELHTIARFSPSETGKLPKVRLDILPSQFMVQDTLWTLSPTRVEMDSSWLKVTHFRLQNRNQVMEINGTVSSNPADTLFLGFEDLDISIANLFLDSEKLQVAGIIDGNASFSDVFQNPMFASELSISDLSVNSEPIGNTTINSTWEPGTGAIRTLAEARRNDEKTILLEGDYYPEGSRLDFDIRLDKLRMHLLRPYLSKIFNDINGMASGSLSLDGTLQEPLINGKLNLQKAAMELNFLQTRYSFTHPLIIRDNSLFFENLVVSDMYGETARLNGSIRNEMFRDITLDLTLDAKEFHFLNTGYEDNSDFYGTAYGTGVIRISGPPGDLAINITARTEKNTVLYIPLESTEEIEEIDYIRFINTPSDATRQIDTQEYQVDLSGIRMNFNLEITPDAEAQLIFDSQMGDIIRGRGFGNLSLEINTFGKFRMFGEYEFTEGDYLFTLQNIISKRLEIREGSKIIWNGDPLDASIDLEAVYALRTSLYDLLLEENYRRRIPVECQLFLGNKLMTPSIRFDINLPTADEETKNYLRNVINTEEKLSKQFLSLLVLNSFLPDPGLTPGGTANPLGNYTLGAESVGVTTSELLSNQLSRWLSQISNDLDIGFNYRPGDEINRDQVEVALSTQLLNDRVAITGNLDVGGYQSASTTTTGNTSNIVGDFNVEVKLNESGKLRVKAFNRANDKLIYDQAPYTQGIGLFYREEFDTFNGLLRKYWDNLFTGKEETADPPETGSE